MPFAPSTTKSKSAPAATNVQRQTARAFDDPALDEVQKADVQTQLNHAMQFGYGISQPIQRQTEPGLEEDEETLQRQAEPGLEEEEKLQAKPQLQRKALPEEDKELQMKPQSVQLKCDECATEDAAKQEKPTIQPKLTIGQPGDKYEQEADQMAAKVMTMPDSAVQREAIPEEEELQAKPDNSKFKILSEKGEALQNSKLKTQNSKLPTLQAKGEAPTAPANFDSQLAQHNGSGQPLSDETRAFMEPRFGEDFSNVRVHETPDLANAIQAQAFTHGQDIYFNSGKYNPGSSGGKELLAHELTHVVQQRNCLIQREPEEERKVGPAASIKEVPNSFQERGYFGYTSSKNTYVVRAGDMKRGTFADHIFESRQEAIRYAKQLASLGEEEIRQKSALPRFWSDGSRGNPVEYVSVFELPPKVQYIQGVVAPQKDGKTGRVYRGGGPQVQIPKISNIKHSYSTRIAQLESPDSSLISTPRTQRNIAAIRKSKLTGRRFFLSNFKIGWTALSSLFSMLSVISSVNDSLQIYNDRTFFPKVQRQADLIEEQARVASNWADENCYLNPLIEANLIITEAHGLSDWKTISKINANLGQASESRMRIANRYKHLSEKLYARSTALLKLSKVYYNLAQKFQGAQTATNAQQLGMSESLLMLGSSLKNSAKNYTHAASLNKSWAEFANAVIFGQSFSLSEDPTD